MTNNPRLTSDLVIPNDKYNLHPIPTTISQDAIERILLLNPEIAAGRINKFCKAYLSRKRIRKEAKEAGIGEINIKQKSQENKNRLIANLGQITHAEQAIIRTITGMPWLVHHTLQQNAFENGVCQSEQPALYDPQELRRQGKQIKKSSDAFGQEQNVYFGLALKQHINPPLWAHTNDIITITIPLHIIFEKCPGVWMSGHEARTLGDLNQKDNDGETPSIGGVSIYNTYVKHNKLKKTFYQKNDVDLSVQEFHIGNEIIADQTYFKFIEHLALRFIYKTRLLGGQDNPAIQQIYQDPNNEDAIGKLFEQLFDTRNNELKIPRGIEIDIEDVSIFYPDTPDTSVTSKFTKASFIERNTMCQQMLQAIQSGDIQKLQRLIHHENYPIDGHQYKTASLPEPLLYAVSLGQEAAAAYLINQGANGDLLAKNPITIKICNQHKSRTDKKRKLLAFIAQDKSEHLQTLLQDNGLDLQSTQFTKPQAAYYTYKFGYKDLFNQLEEHWNVSTTNYKGQTLLHKAANHNDIITTQKLINKNADVNAKDKDGLSPLYVAAVKGHTETVKLLIENKADVNAQNKSGLSPLHSAAQYGNTETVKLLIENKADVNAVDKDGFSPLHVAAILGHLETVKLLIENKADVNALDKNGCSPLDTATYNGHTETIKLLIEHHADVNAQDKDGFSPLYSAAQKGHTKTVELLIDNKADVNAQNKNGFSPLHIAAHNGHKETVKLLIENKADVNALDKDGFSPLHGAYNGHTETIKLLIDNKADVNAQNKNGFSPLHSAAHNGHKETVKLLIDNKADVNAQNKNGFSPLHNAAHNGHKETVKLLIDNKAEINAQNKDGFSPLYGAAQNGHTKTVELLIDNKADVNAQNKSGFLPLHIAAKKGHTETVKLLIEKGADINLKNNQGLSTAHLAILSGNPQILQHLTIDKSFLKIPKHKQNEYYNKAKTCYKIATAIAQSSCNNKRVVQDQGFNLLVSDIFKQLHEKYPDTATLKEAFALKEDKVTTRHLKNGKNTQVAELGAEIQASGAITLKKEDKSRTSCIPSKVRYIAQYNPTENPLGQCFNR